MNHNSNTNYEIPLSEKVKSLPGFFGIHLEEEAPYDVLKSESDIEIRCYRPQAQARVTFKGDFKIAQKEAFNALAGYIFGENITNEKIQMTTPVLMEEKRDDQNNFKEWTMSFILPPQYSIANSPKPEDQRISLHDRPLQLVVSIGYAGFNSPEKVSEYSVLLKRWLKKSPWYIPVSNFQTAQFDGPLTIPFFRKNEIHIEVKNIH